MHELLLRSARRHGADKPERYLQVYAGLLAPYRDRDIRLLELGIRHGGSLRLWGDCFPRGLIAGVDTTAVAVDDPDGRIRTYRGRQQDPALLDRVARECAPDGFDIIIDDAAHNGLPAKASFWHLFPARLKPGGLYVIEDWGTAYQPEWGDGAAYVPADLHSFARHDCGMAGFVKELLDECATGALSRQFAGGAATATTPIERLTVFTPGPVAVWKKERF